MNIIGTEYSPQRGDQVLVLARGGIIVANPNRPPYIIHADGTRENMVADSYVLKVAIDRALGR